MKRFIKPFIFLLLFCLALPAIAKEKILSYHSDISIQQNRSVIITEKIKVKAEGFVFKRGIYRSIPTSYALKEGGQYNIGFKILSVQKDGVKEPYFTKKQSNGKTIYIGNKNVFLKEGIYEYTLQYRVNKVIALFDDYDELTWNVNGNAWSVDIDSISAVIHYPKKAGLIQEAVYTGRYGSTQANADIYKLPGSIRFTSTQGLQTNEGMTVSIAWEKGHINYPTYIEQLIFKIQTFSLWIVGGFGLLATLVFNIFFWRKKGKDPEKGIIIPQFDAPENMTAADCAYINNYFKYTSKAFTAALVEQAVNKNITIEDEIEQQNIFSNRQKYTLSLLKQPKNPLSKTFINELFPGGSKTLNIIRRQYNKNAHEAKISLKANLNARHSEKNIIRNTALTVKSWIIPIASIALGIFCYWEYGGHFGIIVLLTAILIGISYLFSRWFPKPTKTGRKLMDHIQGLKQYIKLTEEERLKILNPPNFDFNHFEKMLPYAIALDCADDWQRQFETANPQAAHSANHFMWYHGNNVGGYKDFDFGDIGDTVSSASIPPTKSSSSGGGSFSGGGGFSGGGFGGGGGGGW